MPSYVVPTEYVAGKRVTLDGVDYEPGDVIPNDVVRGLKKLSALQSDRTIVPRPDPHHRRTREQAATPSDVPASVRPLLPVDPDPVP